MSRDSCRKWGSRVSFRFVARGPLMKVFLGILTIVTNLLLAGPSICKHPWLKKISFRYIGSYELRVEMVTGRSMDRLFQVGYGYDGYVWWMFVICVPITWRLLGFKDWKITHQWWDVFCKALDFCWDLDSKMSECDFCHGPEGNHLFIFLMSELKASAWANLFCKSTWTLISLSLSLVPWEDLMLGLDLCPSDPKK